MGRLRTLSVVREEKHVPSSHVSLRTWVVMTRPGFLSITLVACVLGVSIAAVSGHGPDWANAWGTVLLALLVHAAANVLNDWHDALNGADDANTQGIHPFTGGARLIQSGLVSLQDTRRLALMLFGSVFPAGLVLMMHTGGGLLLLGLLGLLLSWAYSAPPLVLMSRGWGEVTVALVWTLVVVGADYVQRGSFFILPAAVAISYGVLVGNILLINGFPDAKADASVNKRTLVVRLGPYPAACAYLGVVVLAHGWLVAGVWASIHPWGALLGLISLPFSLLAAWFLFRHARAPERLKPAIVLTIVSALVHGLAMAFGIFLMKLGFFL